MAEKQEKIEKCGEIIEFSVLFFRRWRKIESSSQKLIPFVP